MNSYQWGKCWGWCYLPWIINFPISHRDSKTISLSSFDWFKASSSFSGSNPCPHRKSRPSCSSTKSQSKSLNEDDIAAELWRHAYKTRMQQICKSETSLSSLILRKWRGNTSSSIGYPDVSNILAASSGTSLGFWWLAFARRLWYQFYKFCQQLKRYIVIWRTLTGLVESFNCSASRCFASVVLHMGADWIFHIGQEYFGDPTNFQVRRRWRVHILIKAFDGGHIIKWNLRWNLRWNLSLEHEYML